MSGGYFCVGADCPDCEDQPLVLVNAARPSKREATTIVGCPGCERHFTMHLRLVDGPRGKFRPPGGSA